MNSVEIKVNKLNSHPLGGNYVADPILAGSAATKSSSDRSCDGKKPNCLSRLSSRFMPNGGFLSGVFNLAGGSLGAGILALPSAFDATGIIMGTIYLVVIYLLTVYSVQILAIAAEKTKIRSYEGMARDLFGRGGDIFTAIIMFVKCFGACVAYVISIGDLISAFLKDDSVTGYWETKSFNRVATCIIFFVFMLPLSLPKRINSLRYVSLFAVSFIVYFVICIVIHAGQNGLVGGLRDDIAAFKTGNNAIRGLGMYMFAFLCQSNMFEVWNEMKPQPSVKRMTYETGVGMLLCTILYWFAGFFGYLDFGSEVSSSILTMYRPLTEPMMAVAYVGIVVKLCVAFSLHILPCRDSAHHLIGWELDTVPWWKNAILCTFMCGVALVMGLFIPNVNVVFGLLGSFTGGFIAFVFPALFFMYAGDFTVKGVGLYHYISTYVLLLSGVFVICFGTTSTIYSTTTS